LCRETNSKKENQYGSETENVEHKNEFNWRDGPRDGME
jgi:hypothetical protein